MNYIKKCDAYEEIKNIKDKSIDCIYTDVPYLYMSGGGSNGQLGKQKRANSNELINNDLVNGFDYKILDDFVRVMKKINIVIWCSKLQVLDIMNYFLNLKDKKINYEILVWCKTNPIPTINNCWLGDVEYALYFRESGVKLNNEYEIKSKYYISGINQKDKVYYNHPTIKPLELVKRHLKHITKKNDIVLDPFIGSGTTAAACIELERRYIGFEKNKDFYEIAINRIEGKGIKEREEKKLGVQSIFDFMKEK